MTKINLKRQRTPTAEEKSAIDIARETNTRTLRPTSPGAEAVMYSMMPVLDHGFIRLVDYLGDDASAPRAARMSYGTGTRAVSDDRALIRYLMRHHHTTPFEMLAVQMHVCCPIFVMRQWVRHRTGSFNEYSGRYSVMDRAFYVPEPEHLAAQSQDNKQGRGKIISGQEAADVLAMIETDANFSYDRYLWMANDDGAGNKVDPERDGLARELARINLTLSTYTQFYWQTNLWNLLNFLRLRADSHAQYEIRVYAETILNNIVKPWVPICAEAFEDFHMNSERLSAQGAALIKAALAFDGTLVNPADHGVGGRELKEIIASFPEIKSKLTP